MTPDMSPPRVSVSERRQQTSGTRGWILALLFALSASPLAAEIVLDRLPVFAAPGFDPAVVHWSGLEPPNGYRRLRFPVLIQEVDAGNSPAMNPHVGEFTVLIAFELPPGSFLNHPSLLLAGIGENWEIYLNGRLLRAEMHTADGQLQSLRVRRNELLSLPGDSLHEGNNNLVFRILGNARSSRTGLFSGVGYKIGEYPDLQQESFDYASLALIPLFLFLGIYHIYLYARTSRFRYGLVYGLYLFSYSIYTLAHGSYLQRFIQDSAITIRIESTSLFASAALMALFMDLLLINRVALVTRVFCGGCALLVLIQLASFSAGIYVKDAFALFEIPQLAWVIRLLVVDFRRELLEHRVQIWKERNIGRWWLYARVLFGSNLGALLLGGIAVVLGIAAEAVLVFFFQKETNIVVISSSLIFLNMTFLITRRFEESIKNEERNEILLQEQEKRHSLETSLVAARERERVFADMHDHLGSRLVDLELMLSNPENPLSDNSPLKQDLSAKIRQVRERLRNRISLLEDEEILKTDFVTGLRMITFRRYQNAGRSVRILINDAATSAITAMPVPQRDEFFAVLTEVTTNDLKYGTGTSSWEFSAGESYLRIVCKNAALLDVAAQAGQGTVTIQSRIGSMEGSAVLGQANGLYTVEILLPNAAQQQYPV